MEEQKLDDPVFYCLQETQAAYAIGNGPFYEPDYCPFGSSVEQDAHFADRIHDYSLLTTDFYMVGNEPVLPVGLRINKEVVCDQMLLTHPSSSTMEQLSPIILLTDAHREQLIELIHLVQPGFFRSKTNLLGNYLGIFSGEDLVAVTGERMQMNAFTEVSGVVTHPDHTGKGYAAHLVAAGCLGILQAGKTPFLHVSSANERAIGVYTRLGFETRRKISFWHVVPG